METPTTTLELTQFYDALLTLIDNPTQQHPHLTSKNCNQDNILHLINKVYAFHHFLTRGPFTTGKSVVKHFNNQEKLSRKNDLITRALFAKRMTIARTSAIGDKGGTSNANYEATKVQEMKYLIDSCRSAVLLATEAPKGIVYATFAHVLEKFCSIFNGTKLKSEVTGAGVAHIHVSHRFIELSELIHAFPSSVLCSRCGVRCLLLVQCKLEEDAATILQHFFRTTATKRSLNKGAGKENGGSKTGRRNTMWANTLIDLTEAKRIRYRLRSVQRIKERTLKQKAQQQELAAKKMQSLFRGKIVRKKQSNQDDDDDDDNYYEDEDDTEEEEEEEDGDDDDDDEGMEETVFEEFHRVTRVEQQRAYITKQKQKEKEYLNHQFIAQYMSRTALTPQYTQFITRHHANATPETDIATDPKPSDTHRTGNADRSTCSAKSTAPRPPSRQSQQRPRFKGGPRSRKKITSSSAAAGYVAKNIAIEQAETVHYLQDQDVCRQEERANKIHRIRSIFNRPMSSAARHRKGRRRRRRNGGGGAGKSRMLLHIPVGSTGNFV